MTRIEKVFIEEEIRGDLVMHLLGQAWEISTVAKEELAMLKKPISREVNCLVGWHVLRVKWFF